MPNKKIEIPKINTTQNMGKRIAESDMECMVNQAAKSLKGFPAKEVKLPLLDRKNDSVEVCYNGYNIIIKRGVSVKLPMPIIRILRHSGVL